MDEKDKEFYIQMGYQKGKSEILKEFHNGYRSGYGQARADLMIMIEEAMSSCRSAIDEAGTWNAPAESVKEIRLRMSELQRIRALIRTMKPNIAGG